MDSILAQRSVKAVLVVAGSLLVCRGVYLPSAYIAYGDPPELVSVQDYFNDATGDSMLLMALAMVCVLLLVAGRWRGLRWTALCTGAFAALMFATEWSLPRFLAASWNGYELSRAHALSGEITYHPAWGWAVLLAGALLLCLSAVAKVERREFAKVAAEAAAPRA
jgi:hypothetical protein